MKTRIAVVVGLLCVVGSPLSASAGTEIPTMSSGTLEPYLSFLAGIAVPRNEDATFTDGSGASHTPPVSDIVKNVNYRNGHSVGGNAGIWFPTRNKLAGFDLGVEITGFIWYPDVNCCQDNYNRDPATGDGTTTLVNGLYVGSNFLVRYPMAISEAYPNGRWHPYVGIGIGAHQLATKPGGQKGTGFFRAITEERDTAMGFMGVGGVKVHVFKYVALFGEGKYIHAHHAGLSSDRFSQSGLAFGGVPLGVQGNEVMNRYASNIDTIFLHAGMSIHFDIRP